MLVGDGEFEGVNDLLYDVVHVGFAKVEGVGFVGHFSGLEYGIDEDAQAMVFVVDDVEEIVFLFFIGGNGGVLQHFASEGDGG